MDPRKFTQSIYLTVKSPEELVFSGEIEAITSLNDKGKFDILPLHANFISIIKETLHIYPKDKDKKEMKIDSGVLRINQGKVEIFLGINTLEVGGSASLINK